MRRLAGVGAGLALAWWLVGQSPGLLGALGGARPVGPPSVTAQALFYRTGTTLVAPAAGRLIALAPEAADLAAGAPVARIVRPGSSTLLAQSADAAASLARLPDPGPRLAQVDGALAAAADRLAVGLREADAAPLPDLRPLLRERRQLQAEAAERQRLRELASIRDLAAPTVTMPESGVVSWLLPPEALTATAVRTAGKSRQPVSLAAGEPFAVVAPPGAGEWAALLPGGALAVGERVDVDGVPARVTDEGGDVVRIATDSLGRALPQRWSRVTIIRVSRPPVLPLWRGGVVVLTANRPYLRWLPADRLPEGARLINRPWLVRPWIR